MHGKGISHENTVLGEPSNNASPASRNIGSVAANASAPAANASEPAANASAPAAAITSESAAVASESAIRRPESRLALFFCSPWLSIAIILAISACLFGRTLGSYFLADDIGEIRYIHQIFNGHADLFWSNFCGNYMQVPNMSVYRPMLLMTLVFDYAIWKGNPLGYYLSNLTYFACSATLLCLFVRQLSAPWGKVRAAITGLAAACLFVTNPLHCESISWVVGRVDSACCTFYLAALCIFMSGKTLRSAKYCALGLLSFALAICVKEMAIGLAPVLAALAFFFPERFKESTPPAVPSSSWEPAPIGFVQRIQSAWRLSKPIWIATIVYFAIRFCALGTLLGGYNGSVGESQNASAVARWFDIDNWRRLFLPFPFDLYAPGNGQEQALLIAYCALCGLLLLRVLSNSLPWRYLGFLVFWAMTLAAPIYRLWGLGANLEGGRFCYFLSLSVASALPLLLLAPDAKLPRSLSLKLSALALSLLAFVAYTTGHCSYATNLLWLHAGKEVKAVCDDAIKLSKSCVNNQKVMLLGVPKQHSGAHMILNGPTLQMLLAPPFADHEYGSPILTFDPILFGDENLINGARLRALVNRPDYLGPYIWSNKSKHFIAVQLNSPESGDSYSPMNFSFSDAVPQQVSPFVLGHGEYILKKGTLSVRFPHNDDGLRISNLHVNPLAYDYLKLSFRSSNNNITLPFEVHWQASGGDSNRLNELSASNIVQSKLAPDENAGANTIRTIYIPLGRNWRWYAHSQVNELSIFLPGLKEIAFTEIALLPTNLASPIIEGIDKCNSYGVIAYKPGDLIKISTRLGEALQVQLSKKEFFFDNLDGNDDRCGVATTFPTSKGRSVELAIPNEDFSGKGYYQLRARAIDSNAKPAGDFSDPITLFR